MILVNALDKKCKNTGSTAYEIQFTNDNARLSLRSTFCTKSEGGVNLKKGIPHLSARGAGGFWVGLAAGQELDFHGDGVGVSPVVSKECCKVERAPRASLAWSAGWVRTRPSTISCTIT